MNAMPSLNSSNPTISWGSDAIHQRLAKSHAARLSPRLKDVDWEASLHDELICRRMEHELVESERAAIAPQVRRVPTDAVGFAAWFEGLKETGPGQGDVLFPWLAEEASVAVERYRAELMPSAAPEQRRVGTR
jgi:hypothetical protein